jgi:hypothetical protein
MSEYEIKLYKNGVIVGTEHIYLDCLPNTFLNYLRLQFSKSSVNQKSRNEHKKR